MIVVPNHGPPPDAPRAPNEHDAGGMSLVRFGDVLAAVQLRHDPDAAAEATPHVAEVFNAHGFFANAAAPSSSGAPATEDAAVRDGRASLAQPSMTFDTPTRLPTVEANVATVDPSEITAAGRIATGSAMAAVATSVVASRRRVSPASTPIVRQAAMPIAAVPSGLTRRAAAFKAASSSPVRAAPRPPVRPASGAASDAPQVVVRAGEAGVEVVARVERLGDQARATLRARIAAMLSRHGMPGGVVRIIGGTAASKG